jgi:hypothetical protein
MTYDKWPSRSQARSPLRWLWLPVGVLAAALIGGKGLRS